jgi:prophage tail gpP-like protein
LTARVHAVSISVGGVEIRGLTSYDVHTTILEPVHTFSLVMPFSRDAWEHCALDAPAKILIDGVTVLAGFIDEREVTDSGDDLRVTGRNRAGRLVQESAPGITFAGMDLVGLIGALADPWYTTITLSNARNRRVLRGKGKKARAGREPVFVTTSKGSRIEPGQTRWQVIADLCQQAEILCWPAGDGTELVLGLPNYDQEPQFAFVMAADRGAERSNVLGLSYVESIADRYNAIIVVGSGGGTDANYGAPVGSRIGRAENTRGFSARKALVLEKAVRSSEEASAYARREMRRRDMQGTRVSITAAGHGQVLAGQYHTIFAPDLAASIHDERTGMRGLFHVVGCAYRCSRDGGEETVLEFVPRGTELSL